MYTNDREAYRKAYCEVWQKHLAGTALSMLEKQLLAVMLEHPEYQRFFEKPAPLNQEFVFEENPFMHMSLHLGIREQIELDRPPGMRQAWQRLIAEKRPAHEIEHAMMTCLAKTIWEMQQTGEMPDEAEYVKQLLAL